MKNRHNHIRHLPQAARLLGGDVAAGQILCPGLNHSQFDRSLSVKFVARAPDGFIVHSFAGDDPIACREHVKRVLGIRRDARPYVPPPAPARSADHDDQWKIKQAAQIWDGSRSIVDTIAEEYLRRRGLPFIDLDHALQFNHDCPVTIDGVQQARQALVQKLVDPLRLTEQGEDVFLGIQRTFLLPNGSDRDRSIGRRMRGAPAGAVCKLSRDEDVTLALGIGEGVETALSLPLLPECHGVPVWACLSATTLAAFPMLSGIEVLWIAVDKEESGTGERAARQCADRWNAGGVECILVRVRTTARKSDLNDFIREGQGYG